jgi:hypothetical protein
MHTHMKELHWLDSGNSVDLGLDVSSLNVQNVLGIQIKISTCLRATWAATRICCYKRNDNSLGH